MLKYNINYLKTKNSLILKLIHNNTQDMVGYSSTTVPLPQFQYLLLISLLYICHHGLKLDISLSIDLFDMPLVLYI